MIELSQEFSKLRVGRMHPWTTQMLPDVLTASEAHWPMQGVKEDMNGKHMEASGRVDVLFCISS